MGTTVRSAITTAFFCAALLTTARAQTHLPQGDGQVDSEIPNFAEQTAPLLKAALSLPIAGLLGAALAFRPRRRGTPQRTAMVIHTQILLALVGSIVMLVVGSSLARAFGIVGAAGLVRYRAKIDDPKDAGVMLASLAAGLASGSGLYLLATFSTLFILLVLVAIESLGPGGYRLFELSVATKKPELLSSGIEKVLRHNRAEFELRSASNEEVSYQVKLPYDRTTDHVASEILRLDQSNGTSVTWDEKKVKQLES
jgi:uncharacterized membrane protein YhiD involved in acid resistance